LLVKGLARSVTAAAVATGLVVLVVCDLLIGSFQAWWDRHSLTASIVSSLLILATTALIFDEIIARRQRKDRAMSVAIQALIVYGQVRRSWNAVKSSAADGKGSGNGAGSALEEWKALANMLLTASPALFEDPEGRRFLEEVERFSGLDLDLASGQRHLPSHRIADLAFVLMVELWPPVPRDQLVGGTNNDPAQEP
jgi:hypothetical protein